MHRSRHAAIAAILSGALAAAAQPAWAQGETLVFSAMGDVPYGSSEVPTLQRQIADHNRYSPSEVAVHLGDIKKGSASCSESHYRNVSGILEGLAVPCYIVIGDNEWNDCSNPPQAFTYWMRYFANFETKFCGAPLTEHQSARPENWAFVRKGVLFVGITLPGSTVYPNRTDWDARMRDNADWCAQQFASKASQVRAAVICAQAGPGSSRSAFFTPFVQSAAAFGKPVLFLHGDGHTWKMDRPWSQPNLLRVQVNNGGSEDPVQITVTMDATDPFVFRRDPWSGSPPVFERPPCGAPVPEVAVGDASVTEGAPGETVLAQFTVTLSNGDGGTVSVPWSAAAGSAVPDSDFEPASGIVDLSGTSDSRQVSVVVRGDADVEPDETFHADLGAPSGGASLARSRGTGTIRNDDVPPPPVVSGFTPASGSAGTQVTVTGAHFTGADRVSFAGVAGTGLAVDSDSQLRVTVPAGAASGPISVAGPGGAGESADAFTVVVPDIASYEPTDDAQVSSTSPTSNYGSLGSLRAKIDSATFYAFLKFTVAGLGTSGAQNARLRLYCTNGSSDAGSIFLVANDYAGTTTPWTEAGIHYRNAPLIAGNPVAPSPGAAAANRWVEFDVTAAIVGDGTYSFALKNPSGDSVYYSSSEASSNRPVLVVTRGGGADPPPPPAPPAISGFAPPAGPAGTEVTITGSNLAGATAVSFAGTAAASLNVDSSTQVRARVPAGAPSGRIAITTPAGSAQSAGDFIVQSGTGDTLTFHPSHDAQVSLASPGSNYGSLKTLRAERDGSAEYRIFLKFEVAGIATAVQSATLRLRVTGGSVNGGDVYLVPNEYAGTAVPWVEGGIVWDNAPAVAGTPVASAGSASSGTWKEFPVTAAVTADGSYSFALTTRSTDSVTYSSKEGSYRPELVVVTAPTFSAPATAGGHESAGGPSNAELVPTFPSPSRGPTAIEYRLPHPMAIQLDIFDVAGRLVRTLASETQPAGTHRIVWDGRNASGRDAGSGVYFLRLRTRETAVLRRLIRIR